MAPTDDRRPPRGASAAAPRASAPQAAPEGRKRARRASLPWAWKSRFPGYDGQRAFCTECGSRRLLERPLKRVDRMMRRRRTSTAALSPWPPVGAEDSMAVAVGTKALTHAPDKTITYLRHGKSAGNAGLKGCVEMGLLTAYCDAKLVAKGEQQVVECADSMDDSLLDRIVSAQVVLVSPLTRAMASAVILLAQAHRRSLGRGGGARTPWPRVEVVTELREKVKSCSERPGTGEDPMAYVQAIARKYGECAYGDSTALQPVADDICRSYEKERGATHDWMWDPDDAISYHRMVGRFKQRLRSREEANILIVGHSGWARFAFGALLPTPGEDSSAQRRLNLIGGTRPICALRNADVLVAGFSSEAGRFHGLEVQPAGPAARKKPRDGGSEGNVGVLASAEEGIAAGALPPDSRFDRLLLLKLAEYMGTWEVRLFTFSYSGGQAYLSWASVWGQPRGHIAIGGKCAKLTVMDDSFIVAETEGHRPFKVRGKALEDSAQFLDLWVKYKLFCTTA